MDIIPFTYFAASVSLGLFAAHQNSATSRPTPQAARSSSYDGGASGRKRGNVSPEIKAEMLSRISSFFGEDNFAGIQVGAAGAGNMGAIMLNKMLICPILP